MNVKTHYILISILLLNGCTFAKADDHTYPPHVSVSKANPPVFYQNIEDMGRRKISPRGFGVTNPYLSDTTIKALNGKNKTYSNTIAVLTADERKEAIRNNDALMQNSGTKDSTTKARRDKTLRHVNKGITIPAPLQMKYPDGIGP